MTIEDLREQDVLLPEEEWGSHRLETTVPEWPLAGAFLVAGASLVAAYLGDGGLPTWIGVGVFLVMVYLVTWLVDRAVLRQRERFRRERREAGAKGAGAADGTGSASPGEGGGADEAGGEVPPRSKPRDG